MFSDGLFMGSLSSIEICRLIETMYFVHTATWLLAARTLDLCKWKKDTPLHLFASHSPNELAFLDYLACLGLTIMTLEAAAAAEYRENRYN